MTWATPQHTRAEVDQAGRTLVAAAESDPELDAALEVINNWRASHSFPLNTFQMTLRRKTAEVGKGGLVAQRLKRIESIAAKLVRFPTMHLSQMQDIGGCRSVLRSLTNATALRDFYKRSEFKHRLVNQKDYVAEPKESGYRGFHLIYRYNSDRKSTYNGFQVEVQIRSQLQHAWATAVETVGTFLRQSLKASEGDERWRRFFALMGTGIARVEESPPVPDTPARKADLVGEIRDIARALDVAKTLRTYGAALTAVGQEGRRSRYYLLVLRPGKETVEFQGYGSSAELPEATEDYLLAEKSIRGEAGAQAVLVAAESVDALKRAYPNYFLDTHLFLEALRLVLA